MDANKVIIRAMLLSSKNGVRLAEFRSQYRTLSGQELDTTGHANLEQMLRTIPDAVYLRLVNGELVAFGRDTSDTAHISALIKRQRSAVDRRGATESYNHRSYNYQRDRISGAPTYYRDHQQQENRRYDHYAPSRQLYRHRASERPCTHLLVGDEGNHSDRLVKICEARGGELRVTINNDKFVGRW